MDHVSHKLHHKVYSFPVSLNKFFETIITWYFYLVLEPIHKILKILLIVSEKNHPQVWSRESHK
jgi:hypothetical protein